LWGVLEYTLQTSWKTGEGIKYNTARSLQLAVSVYHLWEKMLQFPTHMYRYRDSNVIGASHLSPTGSVIVTLGNRGMIMMGAHRRGHQQLSGTAMWISTKSSEGGSIMVVERTG
jgi:hypothetical protein